MLSYIAGNAKMLLGSNTRGLRWELESIAYWYVVSLSLFEYTTLTLPFQNQIALPRMLRNLYIIEVKIASLTLSIFSQGEACWPTGLNQSRNRMYISLCCELRTSSVYVTVSIHIILPADLGQTIDVLEQDRMRKENRGPCASAVHLRRDACSQSIACKTGCWIPGLHRGFCHE